MCWSFRVVGLEWYPCCASACNTDTTPTQPHRISNTHRTKNNMTNVVIQQNSRKFLMMDILMSETCWAHKKWNKITSDIKLVFILQQSVKGDKSALVQLLSVTSYNQNYETAKQVIKVSNLDYFLPPPILTMTPNFTSISTFLLPLLFFLPLLHVIILLILLFSSWRSVLIHLLSPFLSFLTSSFAWLIFLFQFICFLDSLVLLQFLYVSSSPLLIHFCLFILVLCITFDTPSTPPWYSGSRYSFITVTSRPNYNRSPEYCFLPQKRNPTGKNTPWILVFWTLMLPLPPTTTHVGPWLLEFAGSHLHH